MFVAWSYPSGVTNVCGVGRGVEVVRIVGCVGSGVGVVRGRPSNGVEVGRGVAGSMSTSADGVALGFGVGVGVGLGEGVGVGVFTLTLKFRLVGVGAGIDGFVLKLKFVSMPVLVFAV